MSGRDRLFDMMAAHATEGLPAEQLDEMMALIDRETAVEADELELAASALTLAYLRAEVAGLEPMPTPLRERILAEAERVLPPAVSPPASFEQARLRRSGFDLRSAGWLVAAAVLVLAIWSPWSGTGDDPTPPPIPTSRELRAAMIAGVPDTIRAEWSPQVEEYASVRGDVVWSSAEQRGFMRLAGLPANEPTERQYQLWIVDPARDAEPVDGGVFDVPSGGEVVIPIDAKLQVGSPTVFAITLEQPGGVVVSEGPLLVVAPVA